VLRLAENSTLWTGVGCFDFRFHSQRRTVAERHVDVTQRMTRTRTGRLWEGQGRYLTCPVWVQASRHGGPTVSDYCSDVTSLSAVHWLIALVVGSTVTSAMDRLHSHAITDHSIAPTVVQHWPTYQITALSFIVYSTQTHDHVVKSILLNKNAFQRLRTCVWNVFSYAAFLTPDLYWFLSCGHFFLILTLLFLCDFQL